MSPSRYLSRLLQIVGLGVAAAMLWLTFKELDVGQTWNLINRVGPSAVVILIPFLLCMVADTVAWQRQFLYLGRPLPLRGLLGVRLASEGVLLSVSGGSVLSEGIAPYLLHKKWRVPYSESVASSGARKSILILSQSIYIGVGAILGFGFLQSVSTEVIGISGLQWIMLAIAGGLFAFSATMTVVLTQGAAAATVDRWLAKIRSRRFQRIIEPLRAALRATDQQLQRSVGEGTGDVLWLIAGYFAAWLVETLETYVILRLLGVEVSFVYVWAFEPALSLLRHLVFFVPAGIGFQDVGYVAFFKAIGVEDPLAIGSAFIVLKRSKELLWAAFGLGLLYWYFRQVRRPESTPRPERPDSGPDVKRVLIIGGSNEVPRMAAIGAALNNCQCWYSAPYGFAGVQGMMPTTAALEAEGLAIDHGGKKNNYDFVIVSSDRNIPGNVAGKPLVLEQAAPAAPSSFPLGLYRWVRFLIPRSWVGPGALGQSRLHIKFCVASDEAKATYVARGLPAKGIEIARTPTEVATVCQAVLDETPSVREITPRSATS